MERNRAQIEHYLNEFKIDKIRKHVEFSAINNDLWRLNDFLNLVNAEIARSRSTSKDALRSIHDTDNTRFRSDIIKNFRMICLEVAQFSAAIVTAKKIQKALKGSIKSHTEATGGPFGRDSFKLQSEQLDRNFVTATHQLGSLRTLQKRMETLNFIKPAKKLAESINNIAKPENVLKHRITVARKN